MTDPVQNALDQLNDYGLVVDSFIADGKLRRVKTNDDKNGKKSGWYVAHEFNLDSGRMVISGRFGNWKMSNESQAFKFDASFTPEEKAAFKEQQQNQRRAAEKEKKQRQKQAAKRAERIWPGLPIDGQSDYLARKKIHGFGCRYSRGSIAVSLSKNSELTGIQWIDSEGNKKFLTGTEKQGAYFYIEGEDPQKVIICEGYATGCSIRMATGLAVAVAFDAGNLVPVVDYFKGLGIDVTLAADNDHTKDKNKGLQVASEIAQKFPDVRIVWPEFEPGDTGTDFNDLHVSKGLDAVSEALNRSEPQAFPEGIASSKANTPQTENSLSDFSPPEPPAGGEPPPDPDWALGLKRNDKKAVLPLSSNIELILQNDNRWAGSLAYCDFSYRIIKRRADLTDMQAGEWEDADTARLAIWLSNVYGFEPPRNKITDGIIVASQRHRFHPVREYLKGLTWDKTPRIDDWLADIYEASAEDSQYLAAVGSKFLIGAVARVMQPGCKMDNVMILEGRQGLRKSTSIAQFFGEWFSDAPIPIGDKDAYQNIQGVWCSELAELDSFNKAESTSAKLFFSQVRDRYRPSYGQHAQDYPRQTIFVGTTNQGEYLKDYTGNRRYWPVKCNTVKLDLLARNRDQYWAEALHRYHAGEAWWPDDATRSVFEAEQDQRMQVDPWQYPIEDHLNSVTAEYVTSADVLNLAIEKDKAQITRADQNRISPIMKKLGWVNTRKRIQTKNGLSQRHVYVRQKVPLSGGDA